METPSLNSIIARMGTPGVMTPEEIKDYYLYLTSLNARFAVELADAMAEVAQLEGQIVLEGETSSKARQLASRSEQGISVIKLKGRAKAVEEMIRSLKAAQKYFIEDARNTV